jgi:hypothetical protein
MREMVAAKELITARKVTNGNRAYWDRELEMKRKDSKENKKKKGAMRRTTTMRKGSLYPISNNLSLLHASLGCL